MSVLKYNWGIIGHNKRLHQLESDLEHNNLAHAYLFGGPDKLGKFTVAKKLAHILQCPNNCCYDCPVCQEIARGYHSDTIEMKDNGESIKIEEIREILNKIYMSRRGPYKILLIENVERMTIEAANALLKTLEDPPEGVIFILTTSRVKEILATIISRVRLYSFSRMADQDLKNMLQDLYPLVEEDELNNLATFALGRPGVAIAFMQNRELYQSYKRMYNDICAFVKNPDRATQFIYINDLIKASKEEDATGMVRDFLDVLLAVARSELLGMANGQTEERTGTDGVMNKLIGLIKDTHRAQELLKRNVNTRLLLENLMLQL